MGLTVNNRTNLAEEIPWAIEHFLGEGGEDAQETSAMIDQFFHLPSITDCPLAMINPNVDQLWHSMICHTELYTALCVRRYGEVIHHRPRTNAFPVPDDAVRNFYHSYEASFGEVSDAWERGVPVEVIEFGRQRRQSLPEGYRWSGWPGRGGLE